MSKACLGGCMLHGHGGVWAGAGNSWASLQPRPLAYRCSSCAQHPGQVRTVHHKF